MPARDSPTQQSTCVRLTYQYNGQHIPYQVWLSPGAATIHTVVFLGTVQIGHIAEWVAATCPPGTAVVQGAPHWFAKADGSDIPQYMHQFTRDAFAHILQLFATNKQLHVIAESQSAPCAMRLFTRGSHSTRLARLVLVQPLGFNTHVFGSTQNERIRIFKRRIAQNARHHILPIMTDARLRYNYRLISQQIDFSDPAADAQYNSGLAYNGVHNLQTLLAAGHNVRIICGANDAIIRPQEVQATLDGHGIDITVETVPGVPHSSLATRAGRKLLRVALGYCGHDSYNPRKTKPADFR